MIRISFVYKNHKIVSFEVKGHAESAPYGQDLVCAGVSAVTLGGLNALEDEDSYDIQTKEGDVSLFVLKEISRHDEIVLETIEKQLESLALSYPEFVRLERK